MNKVDEFGPEEWQEWLDSLGTREFFNYLGRFKQHLLESLPEYVSDLSTANQIVGKLQMIEELTNELKSKGTREA